MTQQYTPVSWQDETTSQQGTLINAERLNQMQTAHHYADGFEEVDAVPTANPGVQYHKIVYCTADSTFYRWDGTEWTRDIDDETKALLQQEIARATQAESQLNQRVDDEHDARVDAEAAINDRITDEATELAQRITTEASTRYTADTALGTRITNETSARETADTELGADIGAETARARQAEQTNAQAIATHVADKQNPHEVTKAQIGLGNVDNTADLDKPISIATQSALDGKATVSEVQSLDMRVGALEAGKADREDITSLRSELDTKVEISEGVTPWSATVTYSANAFCAVNGTLYRSLSAGNLRHNPLSSADWWEEYSSGSKQSTGLIGPDNLYAADIGDGTSTVLAVNHGLTSFDILWAIWDGTNKAVTGVKAVKTSADILTLTFAKAPAAGQYRILVFRPGDSARIYTRTFAPTSNEVVINHNLGRLPSGISLYAPDGTRVGVRMTVDTMTATLHLAGYDAGNYTIQVIA